MADETSQETSEVEEINQEEDEDEEDEGVEEMEGSQEEEEEENDKDKEAKEEANEQLNDAAPDKCQDISSPQEEVEKQETVPDGALTESEEKVEPPPQTAKDLDATKETVKDVKDEKPKSIFGSNRTRSLFKRLPSSRPQQSEEKVEGSLEETNSPGKKIVEGSSVSEPSAGDTSQSISSETQPGKRAPAGRRSHSATCSLL